MVVSLTIIKIHTTGVKSILDYINDSQKKGDNLNKKHDSIDFKFRKKKQHKKKL